MHKNNPISAFTLIELSIAIIIIGLIVGGVLGGQSLIESGKRQALVNQVNSFKTALKAFQLEYDALPGDMGDATSYWSGTANGNNDRRITGWNTEGVRAWQQLSLAEIIPGGYNGSDNGNFLEPGVNVPVASTGENHSYNLAYITSGSYGRIGHGLQLGSSRVSNGTDIVLRLPVLSSQDTYKLDKKIDDGLASQGHMFGVDGNPLGNTACTDAANSATSATYYISRDDPLSTSRGCRIIFWIDR